MDISKSFKRKILVGAAALLILISGLTVFIYQQFQDIGPNPPPSEPPKIQQAEYRMEIWNITAEENYTNYTLRIRNVGTTTMNLSGKTHIELIYGGEKTLHLKDTSSKGCEFENIKPAEYDRCSFRIESGENITDFDLVIQDVTKARARVN